jgi:hypothetical protein
MTPLGGDLWKLTLGDAWTLPTAFSFPSVTLVWVLLTQ